jgi:WD40 repeat protein
MADHDGRPRADERAQVFISAKSSDFVHAQPVYRRLVDAGVPTFFSHETLPELRNADYRREIDQALDEVDHMIVVTSSLDNVLAPWVEAEWGFFINEKRSGRKHGNLITMVVGGLAPGDLPPALRYYEVIPLDGEALDKVLLYVREPLRRRSPLHAAPTRSRRPVFRESATFGGQPNVHLLAVARTDSLVATGGYDGAVRVYDARSGTRLTVLGSSQYWRARHSCLVTALEFSPDGRRVAAGHIDGTVDMWDIESEDEIEGAGQHELAVSGLVFRRDGRTLATCGKDGALRLWDLESLSTMHVHRDPAPIVAAVGVPAKEWLLTGMINMTTRRYVIQARRDDGPDEALATISIESFARFTVSHDGRLLATGAQDGIVRLYDFEALARAIDRDLRPSVAKPLREWRAHRKSIAALAFFADPARLATCAMDDHVSIWDTQTGKPSQRIQAMADERFASVAVLEDGHTLAAALFDGRIRLWEEE